MYLFSWLQIKKKIQIQNTIKSIIPEQVKNG